jgi:DNA-binding SARP family transcriptional activator
MIQSVQGNAPLFDSALAKIQIYTFGTLQVVRGRTAVTESDWHTRQARQLLKILVTERPRPVSTDLLIELLWPNSTPGAAATTLRSAINALRNVLEPDRPNRAPSKYIVTQAPGYAFHLTADIWLDAEDFERRLNQAQMASDVEQRLYLLESVLDLYKDDYLISDPYADWLQTERERLRERFFNALLQTADIYALQGRYPDAITVARRLLARDEVRENAYQSLMRFQAESGDSAGALLTYERCRAVLSDELGADPSPLTQTLHQRILNGEIEPRTTPPQIMAPSLAHVEMAPGDNRGAPRLPQRALLPVLDLEFLPTFIGREDEVRQIEERLHKGLDGHGSLLVMDGEAGVGKTRLAYHVLQRAAHEITVISGACQLLEQDLPFAPLADALGRYLYGLPDAVIRSLPAANLSHLAQIMPSLQDHMPLLQLPPPELVATAEESRLRLIDSIASFLITLARLRPLVLFLDDLQWADADTLAVLSRLTQRLNDNTIFVLLAYRNEELADNDALMKFVHFLTRNYPHSQLHLERFSRAQVQGWVRMQAPDLDDAETIAHLTDFLYRTTNGNPLFVTELMRALEERRATIEGTAPPDELPQTSERPLAVPASWPAPMRIQEIILDRVNRLPEHAQAILNLCAVIGRDFSLDLLEHAAAQDPLDALGLLLQRRFLLERPDDRLDFSHQLVRQTVYDRLNSLQRRRLHLSVAEAIVDLGQAEQNPGETAFHYGQSGASYRLLTAKYNVRAGEKRLSAYGFRQAIDAFDRALDTLALLPDAPQEYVVRALQGKGLAYEALFDPAGVTGTYRQLQEWAIRADDRALLLATYTRLMTMLGLLGQQGESNLLLRELLRTLARDGEGSGAPKVLIDLLNRRERIYSLDEEDANDAWQLYRQPAPAVAHPVEDILHLFEPVHAVLPLFDYGWVLLVQGQLGEATKVLETVVDLATATNQPSITSNAYHQLAVTARILGDLEQSQIFNDKSIAINRAVAGAAAELASMLPRISSGFLSLRTGRLDDAERRLRRVVDFLDDRPFFNSYRNSANIGLGLVALARGDVEAARTTLALALADPVHIYPYTHVQALLGLARIAHLDGNAEATELILRQALRFAGRRSLLEEYIAVVEAIVALEVASAPAPVLVESILKYVRSIELTSAVITLNRVLERWLGI